MNLAKKPQTPKSCKPPMSRYQPHPQNTGKPWALVYVLDTQEQGLLHAPDYAGGFIRFQTVAAATVFADRLNNGWRPADFETWRTGGLGSRVSTSPEQPTISKPPT